MGKNPAIAYIYELLRKYVDARYGALQLPTSWLLHISLFDVVDYSKIGDLRK